MSLNRFKIAVESCLKTNINTMLGTIETEEARLAANELKRFNTDNIAIGFREDITHLELPAIHLMSDIGRKIPSLDQKTSQTSGFKTMLYDLCILHEHFIDNTDRYADIYLNDYNDAIVRVLEKYFLEGVSAYTYLEFTQDDPELFGYISTIYGYKRVTNRRYKVSGVKFSCRERVGIGSTRDGR